MLISQLIQLGITRSTLLAPGILSKHFNISPIALVCKGTLKGCGGKRKGDSGAGKIKIQRAEKSGPCRLGFIPEEWFLFFHSKTGVSGPYVFGIVVANYMLSKEIYILEHEYYLGLSALLVIYLGSTRLGPGFAAYLDKGVDEISNQFAQGRKNEIAIYEDIMKQAKDQQWRAEGQKDLMSAKKENIAMQLEAEYRERMMRVYHAVRGRMDYHVKKHRAEARIQQKWMTGWILENVNKSITPELQQQALTTAINDLAAAANRSN